MGKPLGKIGKMSSPARFPLAERELKSMFDPKTWDRAQVYVGAFFGCELGPREIRGDVDGNHGTYTAILRRVGDALECACSCPAADDMDCKHAAALGLTYLKSPASFEKIRAANRTEVRALADVTKYLKGTSLEQLVDELQDREITQKQIVGILGINAGLFSSAKRLENRGRRYGFLNACKLACAYLLETVEKKGRPE